MKLRNLFWGMGAMLALSLVGCADEEPAEMTNGQETETLKGNGFITVSVDATGGSTRATVPGAGDTDGDADDSGHGNAGLENESEVNQMLVILAPTTESSGIETGVVAYIDKPTGTNGLFSPNQTWKVQKGTYNALVVLNPVAGLVAEVGNAATTAQAAQNAYNAVKDYEYTASDFNNISSTEDGGYLNNGFMMSNKSETTITVGNDNTTEGNAAEGTVSVERAIAKVTWRPNADPYTVTINETQYYAYKENGWYVDADKAHQYVIFNKAIGKEGDSEVEYWVVIPTSQLDNLTAGDKVGTLPAGSVVYTKTGTQFTGTTQLGGKDVEGYVFEAETTSPDLSGFVWAKGEPKGEEAVVGKYYVKLQQYVLLNLSDKMYAVRHKTKDFTNSTVFGALAGEEYLYTPSDKTFFNPYEKTLTAINSGSFTLTDLPTTGEAGAVTGEGHTGYESLPDAGYHMSYLFENSCLADDAIFGKVTAIVFKAQMYEDENCTIPVKVLYRYNNAYYREVRELRTKLSEEDKTKITDYSTPQEVKAVNISGLDVYENGECYYYSAGIKHFDNADSEETGIMEFAIMRNNIYSLSVKGLNDEIGSATIIPTPSDPVENKQYFITVNCRILPWIVRYNDIEL